MKKFVKNNIKLLAMLIVIILISVTGATLALTLRFNPISINIGTTGIVTNVRYEKDGGNNDITSITGSNVNMFTSIDTSSISNVENSNNVVKFRFWVSGDSSNPNPTIYDVALNNITMNCELKNTHVKWVLYKNNNLISNGNFSPTFDTMTNNRMVLTTTQQDLTTSEDEYLFAMYIDDPCPSNDLNSCTSADSQTSMLGKSFSANIGIETSTKAKKTNTRTTSTETNACILNGTTIDKPTCDESLVYNGTSQSLLSSTVYNGMTFNQSTATNAGDYTITAKLVSGYKWSDNSVADYVFTCRVNKRSITISTQDQVQGAFTSSPAKVNVANLVSGHTINSIQLSTIGADGGDVITAGNAVIYDSGSNDVTNNYTINYQSTGKIVEE